MFTLFTKVEKLFNLAHLAASTRREQFKQRLFSHLTCVDGMYEKERQGKDRREKDRKRECRKHNSNALSTSP